MHTFVVMRNLGWSGVSVGVASCTVHIADRLVLRRELVLVHLLGKVCWRMALRVHAVRVRCRRRVRCVLLLLRVLLLHLLLLELHLLLLLQPSVLHIIVWLDLL